MIVTIDGPAGAGKSSASRELALRLGFAFLDTGAMYRAVTLAGLRRDTDLRDLAPMKPAADALEIDSTHLTLAQVVDVMEREVRWRAGSATASTRPPTG